MTEAEPGAYRGPALFSLGFRPFFLSAALWAALAAPVWAIAYLRGDGRVLGAPGRDWHVHEMLFGYLAAVVAGFLLTAVPNWTGRRPLTGSPLAGLFALWGAGRLAMLLQPRLGLAAAVIDAAFLVVFAAWTWREVLAAKNWRNLAVCALVTLLALANIGVHLRDAAPDLASAAERLALVTPAMLIAVIGGRIVPNFTAGWLARAGIAGRPAPFGRFDQLTLALTGLAVLAWIARPDAAAAGVLLLAAGAANLARLARWRGAQTGREALVWILHLGYAWLGLALMLLGLSAVVPEVVPRSSGIHALTTGAIGVMTLAVMTRASLGHAGRALSADRRTLAIYLLINAAAILRTAAPLAGAAQPALLAASAALWTLAFLGFAWAFGPMLILPRAATAAG